jgi:hypothetical protein
MRRLGLLLLLGVTVFVLLSAGGTLAGERPDKSKLLIRPGFSDTYQVGFVLLDKDGRPVRITFDDKGGTDVVVIRIDGKDHAFGFEGGVFKTKSVPLEKDRVGAAVTWAVEKIHVTQVVETVKSKTGQWDTCVVSYVVTNKDNRAHSVGVRVILDTHLGTTSKQHFHALDAKEIVSTKADWKGPEVPATLLTMQKADLNDSGLTATFTLRGLGPIEACDRLVLTQFPERDIAFGWDLPVKDMGNDAVVGMYWSPRELKAGATRTVGYGYGGGVVELPTKKEGN